MALQSDSRKERTHNSALAIGRVSCSAVTFVVAENLVLRMKFCGESPALRVAAKL